MMKKYFLLYCLLFLSAIATALRANGYLALPADSTYAVVRVSVCNLREEGRFTSGMSTQALLGMPLKVLRYNGWFEVRMPDDYTGWVHRMSVTPMSKVQYNVWNRAEKVVVTALYGMVYSRANEQSATVSDVVAGNRLRLLADEGGLYHVAYPDGRQGYISKKVAQKEKEWRASLRQDAASILATARSLMGFPYLWAGTSTKGMDCSGFVRTVLFMHDIIIPRDASQQARVGKRLEIAPDFGNLRPGDLVFFGRPATEGKKESVSHVGFYLGGRRFIHSLGDVHIGSFDPADEDYDDFNTRRLLFAVRFLPYINKEKGMNTTVQNSYYQ